MRKLVEHLSDEELRKLPRGGHDDRKLYAAYKAATETTGQPTAILAKTIKGHTLGPTIESRNATHQIKKMNVAELKRLRDRIHLQAHISDAELDSGEPPFFRPAKDSPEYQYMVQRRRELGGLLPRARGPLQGPPGPGRRHFRRVRPGFGRP